MMPSQGPGQHVPDLSIALVRSRVLKSTELPPKAAQRVMHVYPLISIASKAQFCLMLFSFHSESFHWQVIQDLEDPEKQEPFISCSSWICVDGIANS